MEKPTYNSRRLREAYQFLTSITLHNEPPTDFTDHPPTTDATTANTKSPARTQLCKQQCVEELGKLAASSSIGILVEDIVDSAAAPLMTDQQTDRQTPPLIALISMDTIEPKRSGITTSAGLGVLQEDDAVFPPAVSFNVDRAPYKRSRSMFEGQAQKQGLNNTRLRHINTPHFLRQSVQVGEMLYI